MFIVYWLIIGIVITTFALFMLCKNSNEKLIEELRDNCKFQEYLLFILGIILWPLTFFMLGHAIIECDKPVSELFDFGFDNEAGKEEE